MIKAVFLDYTGTILQLRGNDFDEMVSTFTQHSTIKDPDEVVRWYFDH